MRMLTAALALSLLAAGAALAGQAPSADGSIQTPVVYSIETPFQGRRVVIRHDPGGLSAAHRPYEGQASPLEPGSEAEAGPDAANWRFVSPRTGGAMAQYDLEMLEIQARDPLEPGTRYVDFPRVEPFDPAEHDPDDAWSAAAIEAELERGAADRTVAGLQAHHYVLTVTYDFTTYDETGEAAQTEPREHVQDLWLAPELPYSPLQLYPGLSYGYALSGSGKPMIDKAVLAAIKPRLAELGGVVRTQQPEPRDWGGVEGPVVLEISEPQPAAPLDLAQIEDAPVVRERLLNAVVGPLFMAEMLQDGAAISADGEAALSVADPLDLTLGEGRSAWRVTGADDFALAITARAPDGPERGLLVLMRPINGVPEAGEHGVAPRGPGSQSLEAMSAEALAERASKFQAFGTLETASARYVLTGFEAGSVTITSGDARVAGSVQARLQAVRVDTGRLAEPIALEARFDAVEGLEDFSFRSPESRYAD